MMQELTIEDLMDTNNEQQVRTQVPDLEGFLADTEKRALIMAEIATGNREDALDLVQETMMAFATRYTHKPQAEWPPLFYRVLQNKIRDGYRRNAVRSRWRGWLPFKDEDSDPVQLAPDPRRATPETELQREQSRTAIVDALNRLPLRQQQVFMLRVWEGLSVEQTAQAMRCSTGSVKTHLFRAHRALRERLGEYI